LLYPNQSQSIPEANVVVRSNSIYFSKENLWNILEKHIPDKYEKIVYVDADILCTDPNWLNRTAEKLDKYKIVHATDLMYKDIYVNNIHQTINIYNNMPPSPFRQDTGVELRPSIVKVFKKKRRI